MGGHRPGQAAIEFALGLMMFLVLIVGAMDLGRAVWVWNTLAHATSEAAHYGSVPTRTTAEIRTYAIERATGLSLTSGDITVVRGVCGDVSNPVSVSIAYSFVPIAAALTAFGGPGSIPLRGTARMYVERGVPPCAG